MRLRPFIRVVTLLKQSDAALKYEVFLRLNRGGESLNNQEIRNVAFRGAMNDKIYELSRSDFLRKQLKITDDSKSEKFKQMEDAETVLRFMTLYEQIGRFGGALSKEMDDFMMKNRSADEKKVSNYARIFLDALGNCARIWGDVAFKRPEKDGWRDQLLAGMYDAQMLAVASAQKAALESAARHSDVLKSRTKDLFLDENFNQSVRTGTNTPQRIEYRYSKVLELINEIHADERS